MTLPTVAASPEALQQLPTPARPRLDPADVVLPAGYRAEVVLAGLSMPCGMGVDDEGTVYVLEGGSTNLDSMSAFAVAEQLGLALGRPRAVDVAFRVVSEKSAHQLLLREVFLEFAADAVLHRRDV